MHRTSYFKDSDHFIGQNHQNFPPAAGTSSLPPPLTPPPSQNQLLLTELYLPNPHPFSRIWAEGSRANSTKSVFKTISFSNGRPLGILTFLPTNGRRTQTKLLEWVRPYAIAGGTAFHLCEALSVRNWFYNILTPFPIDWSNWDIIGSFCVRTSVMFLHGFERYLVPIPVRKY